MVLRESSISNRPTGSPNPNVPRLVLVLVLVLENSRYRIMEAQRVLAQLKLKHLFVATTVVGLLVAARVQASNSQQWSAYVFFVPVIFAMGTALISTMAALMAVAILGTRSDPRQRADDLRRCRKLFFLSLAGLLPIIVLSLTGFALSV